MLPDGCVDVVFEVGRTTASRAYGAATRTSACPVSPGFHYLGICFRPGQSRHFLTIPANHLTDASAAISGLSAISAESFADDIASGEVFERVDAVLTAWITRNPVVSGAVDKALDTIDRYNGCVGIERLASGLGISRRQLERCFLARVGVTPKFYARIRRWQYAFALLRTRRSVSLASVALSAGFADQSHMSREFRDLAGQSPRSVANGAFVQDPPPPPYYPALERLSDLT